jgi:agmatine deiminase
MIEEQTTTRLPAEWEDQDSILMVFPHNNSDWADDLQSAESVFLRIASSISSLQKLILICQDIDYVKSLFCYHDRISFVKIDTNDTWIRDFGPICVYKDGKRVLLDFVFNGWGAKYEASLDTMVTKKLHSLYHFYPSEIESIDMVLEGGSIDSDGNGTLLTTKKCLLNPNRNPKLSQDQIEQKLKHYFGLKRILWLNHGELMGDDTDAHIDTLARFVNQDTICYVSCDKDDEHYKELELMREELESFRTLENRAYNLIPLPLPSPIYKDGRRLPATYANFLITNRAVLLPVYDDPKDKEMVFLFKELFPDREIIPINSKRVIEEGGSIHCSTMNITKKEE